MPIKLIEVKLARSVPNRWPKVLMMTMMTMTIKPIGQKIFYRSCLLFFSTKTTMGDYIFVVPFKEISWLHSCQFRSGQFPPEQSKISLGRNGMPT